MSAITTNHTTDIRFGISALYGSECDSPLPSHNIVREIAQLCRRIFFRRFYGTCPDDHARLESLLGHQIALVTDSAGKERRVAETVGSFTAMLGSLQKTLATDIEATYRGDPAATCIEEVVLCYPGIYAITNYRIAHALHCLDVPLIPRMICEQAHSLTGIDIHPAAVIGPGIMIDHGTGIVIGATCRIGRNVKIYQGVTLGARSFETDSDGNPVKGVARHPVVGDNVVIYSNATILGRVTIGHGAVIGGNVWVTRNVAPGEKLIQAEPEKYIRSIKKQHRQ